MVAAPGVVVAPGVVAEPGVVVALAAAEPGVVVALGVVALCHLSAFTLKHSMLKVEIVATDVETPVYAALVVTGLVVYGLVVVVAGLVMEFTGDAVTRLTPGTIERELEVGT